MLQHHGLGAPGSGAGALRVFPLPQGIMVFHFRLPTTGPASPCARVYVDLPVRAWVLQHRHGSCNWPGCSSGPQLLVQLFRSRCAQAEAGLVPSSQPLGRRTAHLSGHLHSAWWCEPWPSSVLGTAQPDPVYSASLSPAAVITMHQPRQQQRWRWQLWQQRSLASVAVSGPARKAYRCLRCSGTCRFGSSIPGLMIVPHQKEVAVNPKPHYRINKATFPLPYYGIPCQQSSCPELRRHPPSLSHSHSSHGLASCAIRAQSGVRLGIT